MRFVSLGLRLCHIKSCFGALQTDCNYLVDTGLWQSWMGNPHASLLRRRNPSLARESILLSWPHSPSCWLQSPWKKTEHTLLDSFWTCFIGFNDVSSGAKTLMDNNHTWEEETSDSPICFPGERATSKARHLFSSCTEECTVLPPALQSPCSQTPCDFIYMCFHISFLYVTAASVWQQVTKGYRFHGHRARCHHTKQSQFPWAAYDMHCWSNILPRVCHCSDINIFFPRLNMSYLFWCVYIGVSACACVCDYNLMLRTACECCGMLHLESSGVPPVPRWRTVWSSGPRDHSFPLGKTTWKC